MTDLLFHGAALYFGWMVGYFGFVACGIWALALYSVFGEGRLRYSSPAKYPPRAALKRLLLRMPLLALVHPLPWALGAVVYLAYVLLTVPMRSAQLLFGVAVLAGFGYGAFQLLVPLSSRSEGSTK